MIEKVIFTQSVGRYTIEQSMGKYTFLLGLFLSDDLDCCDKARIKSLSKWILDNDDKGRYGNISSLEKNKNYIVLEIEYIDSHAFFIPKNIFAVFLLDWYNICKEKPKKIIVTWDGKHIHVEGKD